MLQGREPYHRQSSGHLEYSDRVSVLSGQYSDRLSVHSADRPAGYPPAERYAAYSEYSPADRHNISVSDRTGGVVLDGRVIDTAGGNCGAGTVVRVSVPGGDGVPAERGPPAGSHRVLLKLRHRAASQTNTQKSVLQATETEGFHDKTGFPT